MYPFPEVQNIEQTPQYRAVEQFLTCEFWQEKYSDLFAENVQVDFPHAVPGFLQHLNPFEFRCFCRWLQKTVQNHRCIMEPCIIPTTDPDLFWTIRWVEADVNWAMRAGKFQCEILSCITLKNEKITAFRDYANPTAFYRAIGVTLPHFNYMRDLAEQAPVVRMAPDQKTRFTVEENIRRAVANFADPINGQDGDPESIYAENLIEVCPFVPADMPEVYSGTDFDIQTEWMFRNVPEWNTPEQIPMYQSVDPHVIIVESFGYGRTCWSNADGHYHQREIQIVHLDDSGKVDHFRVYFNCINKFFSMNQMIPSFPYLNY